MRHEKARRQTFGGDGPSGFTVDTRPPTNAGGGPSSAPGRPAVRRKVSEGPVAPPARPQVLSPLNPKARPGSLSSQGASLNGMLSPRAAGTNAPPGMGRMSPTLTKTTRVFTQNRTKS